MRFAKLIRSKMNAVGPVPKDTRAYTQTLQGNRGLVASMLIMKLHEETSEVSRATTREQLVDELGDVLHVFSTLCMVHGVSPEEVASMAQVKDKMRGTLLFEENGEMRFTILEG